jgi:hypothetical protein
VTKEEMTRTLRFKAENIKAKIWPGFFLDVANELEKPVIEWKKFAQRPIRPEEKNKYPHGTECIVFGEMPEHGERILVSFTDGRVDAETCIFTGIYELENGADWKDIVAWAHMPEPYKEDEE